MKRVAYVCLLLSLRLFTFGQANTAQSGGSSQSAAQQVAVPSSFTSSKGFVLEDATPVRLRVNRTVSSSDAHVGDTIDFEVLDDITLNGTLVIPKGGLAFATVTQAQAKRRMARGGKLDINIDYVKLVNGEKAASSRQGFEWRGAHGSHGGGNGCDKSSLLPRSAIFSFHAWQRHHHPEGYRGYSIYKRRYEAGPRQVPGSRIGTNCLVHR
jgi:hypothetical protein